MPFEGIEKKLELLIAPGSSSLRRHGRDFWDRVVRAADASIISEVSSESCQAYLLSESSLFVSDRRLVMITCGFTNLVSSVEEILQQVDPTDIRSLIYERKNEHFPELQPSDFNEDAEALNRMLPGTAVRFGDPDGHHVSLYHLNKRFVPDDDDVTLEVLMYNLDPEVRAMFCRKPETSEDRVRGRAGVDRLLPGFTTDDYFFEPVGYSLNGIRGDHYYAVHVTPEEPGSYASFETNFPLGEQAIRDLTREIVSFFGPRRFDVVLFRKDADVNPASIAYRMEKQETRDLSCGYRVQFSHFERQGVDAKMPEEQEHQVEA
jgi:S-adenosylmethionine decarboxylase